ncbi:MAG: FMN-binding negative transcriptional regulator [Candidatus Saccharibacteria bacterium]|nr:FMN-binding negative transcriptional regulator [Rhodoferax sp.]
MYNPSHFVENRADVLQALVKAHPLATLVTFSAGGLVANYIPMLLRQDGTALGTLVAHVARANPVWSATDFGVNVLACFQGPQAYISPSLYATKQEHGKVVPTWNYVAVQASGPLNVHDDAEWIRAQVTELTQQQEVHRNAPWAVDDAPRNYTDTLIRALVGISIPVVTMTGKWKVSQNQPPVNRTSVAEELAQSSHQDSQSMAVLVRQAVGFAPPES